MGAVGRVSHGCEIRWQTETEKRMLGTGSGIIFKGSGFYETDYKTKTGGDAKGDSGAKAEAKSETKADSGGESKASAKSEAKTESKPKAADKPKSSKKD